MLNQQICIRNNSFVVFNFNSVEIMFIFATGMALFYTIYVQIKKKCHTFVISNCLNVNTLSNNVL